MSKYLLIALLLCFSSSSYSQDSCETNLRNGINAVSAKKRLWRDWPLIKVCGIQNMNEARIALQNGANTIGLLIGLTHKAEDKISPEKGREIADMVHHEFPNARVTLVTHLIDPSEVQKIAEFVNADAIQIHDDMSPVDVSRLRERMPQVEILKAIHVEGNGPVAAQEVIAKARTYTPFVDALITDSKSIDPDGAVRIGGTGKRHDPKIGRLLVEAFPGIPIILAGGLNADNVEQAIGEIQPAGIDANSGLENPDGTKNAAKISTFATTGRKLLKAVAR